MFRYGAFGLNIDSEYALPELVRRDAGEPDLVIRRGAIPSSLSDPERRHEFWSMTDTRLLLNVPGVASFLIQGGCEIRVASDAGCDEDAIGLYLLGSCMGAILHQRGEVVLHASTIAFGNQAVAICGRSGAGKSTLCAHLLARGGILVSDDQSVVAQHPKISVVPSYPQIKVSAECVDLLGADRGELRVIDREGRKYALPMHARFCAGNVPLKAIFVTRKVKGGNLSIGHISQPSAMREMRRHTFRKHYISKARFPAIFAAWKNMTSSVPIFSIERPENSDTVNPIVEQILAHVGQPESKTMENAL